MQDHPTVTAAALPTFYPLGVWDFALCSGLWASPMAAASPDPTSVCNAVESRCSQAGFLFCPLLELVGGDWSGALRSAISWVSSECERSGSVLDLEVGSKIAQHRENARASLKCASAYRR